MAASGADTLANTLLTALTADKDFSFPTINIDDTIFGQPAGTGVLYGDVEKIQLADLTTGEVGGTGAFDQLMVSLVRHLKVEYEASRISGTEYTKAYLGAVQQALATAQQFVLAKDQAYWGALLVQIQARAAEVEAVRARVELETARIMAVNAQYMTATAEANYGLTKIKISSEDANYGNLIKTGTGLDFNNTNILPAQSAGMLAANANATKQGAELDFNLSSILPKQASLLTEQHAGLVVQTANAGKQGVGLDYTNSNILPAQEKLLKEQAEVQRAQTLDTRTDLTPITGSVGKQKELYGQQIISYQRDAETKAAKMFSDAWITQKTIDEGLLAPDGFTNASLDTILTAIKTNNNLN